MFCLVSFLQFYFLLLDHLQTVEDFSLGHLVLLSEEMDILDPAGLHRLEPPVFPLHSFPCFVALWELHGELVTAGKKTHTKWLFLKHLFGKTKQKTRQLSTYRYWWNLKNLWISCGGKKTFTCFFWLIFQACLYTVLNLSSSFFPQEWIHSIYTHLMQNAKSIAQCFIISLENTLV